MPEPWHPYVFDVAGRRFVGEFDDMYRAGAEGEFDAWRQSDPRRLDSRVASLLIEEVTYASAVDLGCGKGTFTVRLKRRDNTVVGVDISEVAVATARAHFPDVEWVCAPSGEYLAQMGPVDLIVARELLSYLEDWREQLARCASVTRYLLVGLYLPPDPIGFVKSHAELARELERHFEVLEVAALERLHSSTYLCRSRG